MNDVDLYMILIGKIMFKVDKKTLNEFYDIMKRGKNVKTIEIGLNLLLKTVDEDVLKTVYRTMISQAFEIHIKNAQPSRNELCERYWKNMRKQVKLKPEPDINSDNFTKAKFYFHNISMRIKDFKDMSRQEKIRTIELYTKPDIVSGIERLAGLVVAEMEEIVLTTSAHMTSPVIISQGLSHRNPFLVTINLNPVHDSITNQAQFCI